MSNFSKALILASTFSLACSDYTPDEEATTQDPLQRREALSSEEALNATVQCSDAPEA